MTEEESIFSFATTNARFNKRTNKKDLIASHSYASKTKNKGHQGFMNDCQLREDASAWIFFADISAKNLVYVQHWKKMIIKILLHTWNDWLLTFSQLSNLWWMSNRVCQGFGPAIRAGSSRQIQLYVISFMWVLKVGLDRIGLKPH